MATIASLVVSVAANTAKFVRDMRGASATVGSFAGSVKASLPQLNALTGALGIAGLSGVLMKSTQLIREQFGAERRLGAVLKATGYAAGLSAKSIKEFAATRQDMTNFGDEATIAASSVLATFKQIKGETFKEALVAAQDMSAVLGQDLQSSVVQLGKALNDPVKGVTALSDVGVSFTQQQRDQILVLQQTNDLLGAQKVILNELKSEFGGAAEAAADPLTQMKNRLADIPENVARKYIDLINALGAGVGDQRPAWIHEGNVRAGKVRNQQQQEEAAAQRLRDLYAEHIKLKEKAADVSRKSLEGLERGVGEELARLKDGIDPLDQQMNRMLEDAASSIGRLDSSEYIKIRDRLRESVVALKAARKEKEEQAKATTRQREVSAQARAIRESVQEPWEKFTFQLNDIAVLKMAEDGIDELTADKAEQKAAGEYLGGMPEYREPVLIGSAARGSAAAYESMVKAQNRTEMPEDKIRVAVEKAYQEAVKHTSLLTAIKDKEAAKIVTARP